MSKEFEIDDAKLQQITKEFPVSKEVVEIIYKEYKNFSPCLQGQYLAHVMRGLECYFRKKMKNDRFIVICEPYKEFCQGQKQASAFYFRPRIMIRSRDKKNSSFIINYNDKLPEKMLRDYLAHEIGHLFWVASIEMIINRDISTGTEPLSSIFGIFTMSEKNDFYDNYDVTKRNHVDWQELLDYFKQIHNS